MAAPRRRGRLLLVGGVILVGVPALAWGGLNLLLRDSVLRPRLVAAVEQATGRQLTLSGPVGVKLSLVPTITLEGVALANAPGGSRPEMLTARRVEAELALFPLLSRRLAFQHVTLIEPDLLLELDASGNGNWRFGPPRPQSPGGASPAQAGSEEAILMPSVAAVDIEGGKLTWRDARSGRAEVLGVQHFALRAAAPAAPLTFQGAFGLRGLDLAAEGSTGPLPRLLGASTEPADWPLRLSLTAPGLQAVLDGGMRQPEAAAGWHAHLEASADRAERLAPLLPDLALPPLTGLRVTADMADAGQGAFPAVQALHASVAGGDLGRWLPGLSLGSASLDAAGADQPPALSAALDLRGLPLQARGELPPLTALRDGAAGPLRLTLSGPGMTARFEGSLPARGAGDGSGTLSAEVADTAPLLAAFALPAPRLTEARFSAGLALSGSRFTASDLHLQAREAVLEGEAAFRRDQPRPAVAGRLTVERLDLDALLAPVPAGTPAPPVSTTPEAATPAVPPRPPLPPRASAPGRVIPALPLPLAPLRQLEADFPLQVQELRAGGVTYRDLSTHVQLAAGRLGLDPLAVTLPGGRLAGSLTADAAAEPPRLTLAARQEGAGLDLRPMLQAYGLPPQASGQVELDTALQGAGADLQALAASLSGHFGLALANGQIDNQLLERLGGGLRKALVPNAPNAGSTALRCVALRLNLQDGVAHPQAMLIETALADVVGSGEINLRDESLALRLLPQVRIGGVGLTAPVLVGGSFANPSYRLDPSGAAAAAAGIVGDLVGRQMEGQDSALGQLAQQLAGRGTGRLPDCAQQLAVARGGRQGPVPPEQPQRNGTRQNSPLDLLRGLLGR
ncbi:AsmA family protein [Roseomonas sp. E05]|uniref:AsmA family protein n=1 Tax=Roseomonas sp. E05 TaxID=3046310 RepID=UPI0024BBD8C1|nr:AsmA family protein [Roseomonas sp. E05]MDJ0389620.1 AsmA family protein [Roseomonas sp. E05]